MNENTIAAIATPSGSGGVAVIRISGEMALPCADYFFQPAGKKCSTWNMSPLNPLKGGRGWEMSPQATEGSTPPNPSVSYADTSPDRGGSFPLKGGMSRSDKGVVSPEPPERGQGVGDVATGDRGVKRPSEMNGYTCAYGYFLDGTEVLDDVILTVFRNPHSYTGEDVVEISCHGGRFLAQKILRLLLTFSGVRLAEAGEFTKRAFLNGKLSLTQAEAVADLISASGENSLRCARMLRDGATFRKISAFSETLLEILSDLAVWADYPDEDIPEVDPVSLMNRLKNLFSQMEQLMKTYDYGKILREGLHTVIVGKPNVGKSTLFNALSGYERSIVTDIAGTTRDVVEEQIRIGEILLRLSDTAGVHSTEDQVEKIGVERSFSAIQQAELILAVVDTSAPLSEEDQQLFQQLPPEKTILIYNKTDKRSPEFQPLENFSPVEVIELSAKTLENVHALENAVQNFASRYATTAEDGMIANERQRICLQTALQAIQEAMHTLEQGYALDAVTVNLDIAEEAFLQLTGEKITDKVVDTVFSRFCVGK